MKHFHVQFHTHEHGQWEHPFVNRCEGIVSSEIDELRANDIRLLFDCAFRFAFIECQEISDPARVDKRMEFLKSRLGRFSKEKEVRLKMIDFPIGGRDAVVDPSGPHAVRIIYDILPLGADPIRFSIHPSGK